jgi:hypothetical protein
MSYKDKPQIKLYKYEYSAFVLQAIIDDFQEVSFEHNLYEAGQFTISINYNIPNALLFQRGLFIQFGNNPYDFGEIQTVQDSIGEDGKGSQVRTITGYDSRYLLKRRVIKNMNSNGLWVMTDKGEIVLRSLIQDQCGSNAEAKRQLPITNIIPASESALGKEFSVSENFTNLYEVCKTIATQSEIGWRMKFDGTLTLEVYEGQDLSQTVRFDTNFESLANGEFSDSAESYTNAIYIGGKGQNDDRDIYEGEDGEPSGLDRFEAWDNQSSMTTESEYETEALSMLTQYGQTLTMNGNGLAKCPYVFREQYDIGDTVTVAFSGKSAKAQILSITEHWTWGSYDISFAFGKPQNNLSDQLQLMLRKIQEASNKTNSTDSVRWYTIPTDTTMPKADVTYNTIGFVGTCAEGGSTFTLYLDTEKTGAKTYHIYFKQLAGGNLTLTTGRSGATDLVLNSGTYVAIIYVDENGNVTSQGSTPTSTIASGNNQPATSSGVAGAISSEATARDNAIDTSSQNLKTIMASLPTDAVLHYSFDEVPDYPDGTADVRLLDNNTYDIQSMSQKFLNNDGATFSNSNGKLQIAVSTGIANRGAYIPQTYVKTKVLKIKIKITALIGSVKFSNDGADKLIMRQVGVYELSLYGTQNLAQYGNFYLLTAEDNSSFTAIIEQIYIGDGSYSTPIIDNANGEWNSTSQSGVAVQGVSGKGMKCLPSNRILFTPQFSLNKYSMSIWVNPEDSANSKQGAFLWFSNKLVLYNGLNSINALFIQYYMGGSNVLSTDFGNLLTANTWSHIVIVRDTTTIKLYVNGVLKKTSNVAEETGVFNANANISLTTNKRNQSYDDLLIFNRALSETEVLALYLNKANTPKYYPPLNIPASKIPLPPSTDGSYTLKVDVSNGQTTYSWV